MSFEGHNGRDVLLSKKSGDYSETKKFPSLRMYVAFLSLVGCAIMYLTRVNLTVAILAMVNSTRLDVDSNLTQFSARADIQCPAIDVSTAGKASKVMLREFDWSPPEQGIVLGSFFYGKSYIFF